MKTRTSILIVAALLVAAVSATAQQGISARATNGYMVAPMFLSNNIVLLKASNPYSQIPYANTNNGAIGTAISNAVAGDKIYIGPGTYMVSNTVCIPSGVTIQGSGPSTIILNQIHRGVSDAGGLSGPCLIPMDNVTISDLRGYGVATVNNLQNTPFIGTIEFDIGNPSSTNVVIRNVSITNMTTGIYVRHTNHCRWLIENCVVNTRKQSLFVGYGNHDITAIGSVFSTFGPDTISGDSSEYVAYGAQILSGTNRFLSCVFSAANPKYPSAAATNAIAVNVNNLFNTNPVVVSLVGCHLSSFDTNSGGVPLDIANAAVTPYIECSITVNGCDFSPLKTFGTIQFGSLPVTASTSVNTNRIIVTGAGDVNANGFYTNLTATSFRSPNLYLISKVASHWEITDDFSATVYTNNNASPTGATWYVVSGAPAPAPSVQYYLSANNFLVLSGPVTFNGVITGNGAGLTNVAGFNTNIAGAGMISNSMPVVTFNGAVKVAGTLEAGSLTTTLGGSVTIFDHTSFSGAAAGTTIWDAVGVGGTGVFGSQFQPNDVQQPTNIMFRVDYPTRQKYGLGSFATNYLANANTAGYTNSRVAPGSGGTNNMVARVVGTSGTLEFYNRSGEYGATVCGVGVFTNTISSSTWHIPIPVNSGFIIRSGSGVDIQVYAQ